MTIHVRQWISGSQVGWKPVIRQGLALLEQLKSRPVSADYQAWRHQFMLDRLRLALWIAIPFLLTETAANLYVVLANTEQFSADVTKVTGDPALATQFRNATITACLSGNILLVICAILQRIPWLRRYPTLLFLSLSWSITLNGLITGAFFGIPSPPDAFLFLMQAVLIPVHWRLHLVSQLVPIVFSFGILPLLGLTHIGEQAFYNIYSLSKINNLFWICLICNLAVYLYERLKQSEFEARRQLQVFLHSVSHDLQNPVVGASIVLKSLLGNPDAEITVKRSVLERLLEGSDRQLTLINSLLEAHKTEIQGIVLHREPIQLKPLVDSALVDFQHTFTKNRVQLTNRIADNLPLINADANQLWRVFSNLINNALKHNPPGLGLTLDAEVVEAREVEKWRHKGLAKRGREKPLKPQPSNPNTFPMLLCTVQDNGEGIAPQQCQRLFELYARGSRSRYMPGLGLGLYLCKQIITAHGGEMGVISHLGEGSTFWFTLPLDQT